ncbi:MAG: OmpA family protein [Crocinitomicaceae bacterium]|nr:OmpA family protein [Crocinitomicaceae bacterium]
MPTYANYGGVTLSLDNKEMFICACQYVNYQEHANCDLYVTRFERSGEGGNDFIWSPLENLGPTVNTKDGWEAQPTLSADGNTLYFATWREGSQLTDIYYSTRNSQGGWTTAKPVPGGINTDGHDKAPFLHQDSETLYFVSDCSTSRLGAGGSDIFYTRKDESGNWQTPTNIGYPINSQANEVAFIVSFDGHVAYYTFFNVNTNSYDIFYFDLYEAARPKAVKIYKGEVKDEAGEPIKDAIVEVSYKESGESVQVKVNGDDGKFTAVVMADLEEDVMITVKKEGYSFDTELLKADEVIDTIQKSVSGIQMEIDVIKVGKAFTIDDILFDTDSYVLSSDSKFILDQFVKFLNENPTVTVTIQGHTDDLGDDFHNKELSASRAKSVMDYIISKGISADRLKSEGYGESKPKVPNNSAQNRAQNRRTDFLITGM